MTNTSNLSELNLRQFTGSENWYRHGINRDVLFTDGAKFVADEAGAYWLLDTIAICQRYEKSVSAPANVSVFPLRRILFRKNYSCVFRLMM